MHLIPTIWFRNTWSWGLDARKPRLGREDAAEAAAPVKGGRKAKAEAARLISEKPRRKGKWAEWVRAELDGMTPPEYASMVRSEVNKLMAAAK